MRVLLMILFLIGPAVTAANESTPKPTIDPERVTVSGISSGAHMAQQLHIAYSDLFSGAGILSGGPFGCADNSLTTAMSRCMMNTDPLPVADLVAKIQAAAAAGNIADTTNLADDRVWLFHGTADSTISAEVHEAAAAVYDAFIPAENIRRVTNVEAGHFFPARGRGHACTELKPPFVGDCDYDAAGELLQYLYPGLQPPSSAPAAHLQLVTLPGADDAGLLETAYLYVPPACADGARACALHLVLHGCGQSAATVGTDFIEQSGYLPWADANDIVVAFPQVEKSLMNPLNPHTCWDWWGYTGENCLWRDGPQMKLVAGWIKTMAASE